METRYKLMTVNKAGGNSSKNALSWKISIPNKWAEDMGIDPEDREVEQTYDHENKTITIKKKNKP